MGTFENTCQVQTTRKSLKEEGRPGDGKVMECDGTQRRFLLPRFHEAYGTVNHATPHVKRSSHLGRESPRANVCTDHLV